MSKHTVRNDIHAGFLGFYLDFERRWWKKPGRSEAIDRAHGVMQGIQDLGIRVVDFFTFVEDLRRSNKYLRGMSPWKRRLVGLRRPFDFEKERGKFYKCYEKFCELLLEHRLRPCSTLFLRHDYLSGLFDNNVQDIRNMADPAFLHYAVKHNDRVSLIEADVFGADYGQWRKISNEWSHHEWDFGQTIDERGHFIADFHQDMWYDSLVASGMPLRKLIMDISHSEFVKAWFSQPSQCPKCTNRYFDDPNLRDNNDDVIIIPELHGYSIEQNLGLDYERFLHHAPHNPKCKFHEDGGGGEEANGYAVGRFKIGDNEQSYEFGKKLWSKAKEAGKQSVFAPFPLETLVKGADGIYREDYRAETINWERLRGHVRAHGEVYDG